MLDRKMWRDLAGLRAQALAIVLLVASGVAVFVMSLSNYITLTAMLEQHYTNERFADVFAPLKRAPDALAPRLAALDGIAALETRIVQPVRVERPDSDLAVSGRILSLPAREPPGLNALHLSAGRWLDPARRNEVIINQAYAEARQVRPGESIEVILNGRRQRFEVVGIAYSPEFVMASNTGLPLTDDRSFVVLWASRPGVAAAFDMDGAFNDVVARLGPGADAAAVIAALDRLLEPYGGAGAYPRRDQVSHRFVEDELAEQKTLSIILPVIFLGIASFLLHVVLGRLVEAQREQIAALKALGYPDGPILRHYLALAGCIVALGVALGAAFGAWLAAGMIELYRPFFRFPLWQFEFRPLLPLAAGALAFLAGFAGVYGAVRRVVMLPAAVAMRPPVPAGASGGALGRWLGARLPGPRARMVLRALLGRPLRTGMTLAGLAFALPLIVMGLFWWDSIGYVIELNFERIERADTQVTLGHAVPARAVREIAHLPGVIRAEGQRVVSARLRHGHLSHRIAMQGLPEEGELKRPLDAQGNRLDLPPEGALMSRRLAHRLGVRAGDDVTLEVLEGERPTRRLSVVALSDDVLGLSVYMARGALNRLLREDDVVNLVALTLDPGEQSRIWRDLRTFPRVEAVTARASLLAVFREKLAGLVVVSAVFLTGFGLLIALGVIYNAARIAFHERAWELASLRILGFTRQEVARLFFAELAVLVGLAIPLGLVLAKGLIALVLRLRENESFDLPAIISPFTLGVAALLVVLAAVVSAASVQHRIATIDLVGVLKTRD